MPSNIFEGTKSYMKRLSTNSKPGLTKQSKDTPPSDEDQIAEVRRSIHGLNDMLLQMTRERESIQNLNNSPKHSWKLEDGSSTSLNSGIRSVSAPFKFDHMFGSSRSGPPSVNGTETTHSRNNSWTNPKTYTGSEKGRAIGKEKEREKEKGKEKMRERSHLSTAYSRKSQQQDEMSPDLTHIGNAGGAGTGTDGAGGGGANTRSFKTTDHFDLDDITTTPTPRSLPENIKTPSELKPFKVKSNPREFDTRHQPSKSFTFFSGSGQKSSVGSSWVYATELEDDNYFSESDPEILNSEIRNSFNENIHSPDREGARESMDPTKPDRDDPNNNTSYLDVLIKDEIDGVPETSFYNKTRSRMSQDSASIENLYATYHPNPSVESLKTNNFVRKNSKLVLPTHKAENRKSDPGKKYKLRTSPIHRPLPDKPLEPDLDKVQIPAHMTAHLSTQPNAQPLHNNKMPVSPQRVFQTPQGTPLATPRDTPQGTPQTAGQTNSRSNRTSLHQVSLKDPPPSQMQNPRPHSVPYTHTQQSPPAPPVSAPSAPAAQDTTRHLHSQKSHTRSHSADKSNNSQFMNDAASDIEIPHRSSKREKPISDLSHVTEVSESSNPTPNRNHNHNHNHTETPTQMGSQPQPRSHSQTRTSDKRKSHHSKSKARRSKISFDKEGVQELLRRKDGYDVNELDLPEPELYLLNKFVIALSNLSVEIQVDESKREEGRRRLNNAIRALEGWI